MIPSGQNYMVVIVMESSQHALNFRFRNFGDLPRFHKWGWRATNNWGMTCLRNSTVEIWIRKAIEGKKQCELN